MPSAPDRSASSTSLVTAANLLTASRLLFLPLVIIGIVAHQGIIAAGAMLLTIVSDLLDGRVARRLRQQSSAGGTFDSVIDFVFIYAVFITLYAAGRMAAWQFLVIYLAMLLTFLMQVVTMLAAGTGATMRTRFGKPAGALQYTYLLFLIAREVLPALSGLFFAERILFAALALAILLSAIECVVLLRRLPQSLAAQQQEGQHASPPVEKDHQPAK